MLVVTLLAGVVIGLSLGALGGGGSILTVPVLVYLLHEQPRVATTASLVIVGVTAILAATSHARSGRVRWRAALVFGALGIAASFGGAKVNRLVDPSVLLLSFAALMLVAATAMILRTRGSSTTTAPAAHELATVGAGQPGPDTHPHARHEEPTGGSSRASTAGKVLVAALVVGFLTGFLGVGGGFIIVPALVLALRYEMAVAVGTSLVVISITSLGAFLERLGTTEIPWHTIVPFTIAAVLGSFAGKRVSDTVSGPTLTRAFAGLLVLVAAYVAVQAGTSL
ncbi:sulfite exporter TauE/SafE family protein (plasmid) [Rhodococcus antarcticus]|uniref:Probable membrane transporter protein n=1 Tax=Rhodococcus antarcticus TaxID=2987751 RepID=A0ABY6P5L2_9NOCA|nr:sulfite exporter TauE/SafE family protein [Rhodococcus antarcticus]UZJ26947.1 sulfite exporter TauE/SafE family protein [Rhodococcus antarcticus]